MARCEARLQAPEPNTFSFVIRRCDSKECLGMAGLEECDAESPELGLWMKESAHGQGFGREVVAAVAAWAHKTLGKKSFMYPVAVQNPPAGVSLKGSTPRLSKIAQVRNTSPSSTKFRGTADVSCLLTRSPGAQASGHSSRVRHTSRTFVQSHDILYRVSQDIPYTPLVREAGEGERCLGRRWMCESNG